ncbi:hypothetical protein ACVD2Q_14070, partial [Escherichia coli]
KRAYCLKIQPATGSFARNLIYSTKPLNGIQDDSKLTLRWGDKSCFIQPPNSSNLTTGTVILPCISQN